MRRTGEEASQYLIDWLAGGEETPPFVPQDVIEGDLCLNGVETTCRVDLRCLKITGSLNWREGKVQALDLNGTEIGGWLDLAYFEAKEVIDLRGIRVADEARLVDLEAWAIYCDLRHCQVLAVSAPGIPLVVDGGLR